MKATPPHEPHCTPGDLCERWQIDWKTLNKLPIEWIQLSPTVRRVRLSFVVQYEEQHKLRPSTE